MKTNLFDKYHFEIYEDKQMSISSEKKLCDIIENNMSIFIADAFNEEYVSHTREYSFRNQESFKIKSNQKMIKKRHRIDFFVETKSGTNYAIEVKNYKGNYNLPSAIGQLLGYGSLFKEEKIEVNLVLVINNIDLITPAVIADYNLPIDVVLVREEALYVMEKKNG